MAENAANFTLTYQTKPSIFEVIAQKSLNDTLYPALQKIALVLATNFPSKFRWLNNYYKEAFLALNGLLQYHYLKHYDSSFAENFYGLKRVLNNNDCLTKHHRELSLIFLVIIPYFKKKLDEKVAIIRIEHAEGCLRKDTEGRFKKLILFSHSSFEMVWCLITVYNYLKYMSNQTDFQTPIFKLIDMKLTYAMIQQENSGFWDALFRGNLSVSHLRFGLIKNAITTSLEIGAFFLQCVHMWNAQQSNYNITDLPKVPVPPLDNKSKSYQGKCPICLKEWLIPTILQVSGYIFCFRCILRHLSEHQNCPVTNLPAKPLDIVRLYEN